MMFGTNLQDATNWYVNLATNLVGVPSGRMDFMAPRWTNHVQYYTAQCPMGDNYALYCDDPNGSGDDACPMDESGSMWNLSASQVQTKIDMLKMPKFFIGKFSADFKSQEKSIMIGADPRYMQWGGDAWICTGTTYGSNPCDISSTSPAAIRGERLPGLSVVQSGAFVNIKADGETTVRITDAQGRLVRHVTGSGSITVDARNLAAGAYVVSAQRRGDRLTRQMMIAR